MMSACQRNHLKIVKIQHPGRTVQANPDNHFPRGWGHRNCTLVLLPVGSTHPLLNDNRANFPPDGIVEMHNERCFVSGSGSRDNTVCTRPHSCSQSADFSAVDGHSLQGLREFCGSLVGKANQMTALHGRVCAVFCLPLVMPAVDLLVIVGVQFEIGVGDLWIVGIGLHAAEVFGFARHGDKQCGHQSFLNQFGVLYLEKIKRLLISLPERNDHLAALAELMSHLTQLPVHSILPPLGAAEDSVAVGLQAALRAEGEGDANDQLRQVYRFLGGTFVDDADFVYDVSDAPAPDSGEVVAAWQWFCGEVRVGRKRADALFEMIFHPSE